MRITKKIVKMMGLEPTPEMIETVKTICSLSETGLRSAFQTLTKYTETLEKLKCFLIYFSAYCLNVKAKKAPTEEFKKIISEKYDKNFDVLLKNEEIDVLQEFAKFVADVISKNEKKKLFEAQSEEIIGADDKQVDDVLEALCYWGDVFDISEADMEKTVNKNNNQINKK